MLLTLFDLVLISDLIVENCQIHRDVEFGNTPERRWGNISQLRRLIVAMLRIYIILS